MRNIQELEAQRATLLELSAEFFVEAVDRTESLARLRELEVIRRRAAMRLVPVPKLGFEHLFFFETDQDF